MKRQTLYWQAQGRAACAAGFDRAHVADVLVERGLGPVTNEHRATLRGWDQANVAELREAIRAVINSTTRASK